MDWIDHSAKPKPKVTQVTCIRVVLASVVQPEDISYEWEQGTGAPNTELRVKIRFPAFMNFPVEACEVIRDFNGAQVFNAMHPMTIGFSKAVMGRQADDGWVYDEVLIPFSSTQDSNFVSVPETNLTGFDIIGGSWLDSQGRQGEFHMLQIIVKEQDQKQSGRALGRTAATIGSLREGAMKVGQTIFGPLPSMQESRRRSKRIGKNGKTYPDKTYPDNTTSATGFEAEKAKLLNDFAEFNAGRDAVIEQLREESARQAEVISQLMAAASTTNIKRQQEEAELKERYERVRQRIETKMERNKFSEEDSMSLSNQSSFEVISNYQSPRAGGDDSSIY
jgi:hypothetical protein